MKTRYVLPVTHSLPFYRFMVSLLERNMPYAKIIAREPSFVLIEVDVSDEAVFLFDADHCGIVLNKPNMVTL